MKIDLPTELERLANESGSYGTHKTLREEAIELRRLYRIIDSSLAVGLATGGVKTMQPIGWRRGEGPAEL